jgi:hypothetical protein
MPRDMGLTSTVLVFTAVIAREPSRSRIRKNSQAINPGVEFARIQNAPTGS